MKTNRNKHKIRPPSQADLGLAGGPGKGSRPRSCFSDEFRTNFDEIAGRGSEGFAKRGHKQVKTYQ